MKVHLKVQQNVDSGRDWQNGSLALRWKSAAMILYLKTLGIHILYIAFTWPIQYWCWWTTISHSQRPWSTVCHSVLSHLICCNSFRGGIFLIWKNHRMIKECFVLCWLLWRWAYYNNLLMSDDMSSAFFFSSLNIYASTSYHECCT